MQPRIDYPAVAPDVRKVMSGLEHYVHQAGLDTKLLELVKLRASLIRPAEPSHSPCPRACASATAARACSA